MSNELNPCPFCGSNQIIEDTATDNTGVVPMTVWIVKCAVCGSFKNSISNPDRAKKRWNTRPAEDALKAEVERLKSVIAEIGAMTLTGDEEVEDFIFLLCKNIVGDEEIKKAYKEHLKKDIAKKILGEDNNVLTKESEGKDE